MADMPPERQTERARFNCQASLILDLDQVFIIANPDASRCQHCGSEEFRCWQARAGHCPEKVTVSYPAISPKNAIASTQFEENTVSAACIVHRWSSLDDKQLLSRAQHGMLEATCLEVSFKPRAVAGFMLLPLKLCKLAVRRWGPGSCMLSGLFRSMPKGIRFLSY